MGGVKLTVKGTEPFENDTALDLICYLEKHPSSQAIKELIYTDRKELDPKEIVALAQIFNYLLNDIEINQDIKKRIDKLNLDLSDEPIFDLVTEIINKLDVTYNVELHGPDDWESQEDREKWLANILLILRQLQQYKLKNYKKRRSTPTDVIAGVE